MLLLVLEVLAFRIQNSELTKKHRITKITMVLARSQRWDDDSQEDDSNPLEDGSAKREYQDSHGHEDKRAKLSCSDGEGETGMVNLSSAEGQLESYPNVSTEQTKLLVCRTNLWSICVHRWSILSFSYLVHYITFNQSRPNENTTGRTPPESAFETSRCCMNCRIRWPF